MALALPLLIVPESGLKVPIVLWCSLCQGHETEAIPTVSRQHPLELSLGCGYPGRDVLSHQNQDVEKANILDWLPLVLLILHLRLWGYLRTTCLGQVQIELLLDPQ